MPFVHLHYPSSGNVLLKCFPALKNSGLDFSDAVLFLLVPYGDDTFCFWYFLLVELSVAGTFCFWYFLVMELSVAGTFW